MIKIAPSILSANFVRLEEEIKATEKAGAHLLHVDIMDGHFVPNITIGPAVVASIRKITKLPLDVHLMIDDPDKYIADFARAGADLLTVHYEASVHLHRSVQLIKEKGCKAGVSINPATSVNHLEDILPEADIILIMSVNPGFGGQEFIPHSLEKIRTLRKMIVEQAATTLIEVDGGIKMQNAPEIVSAGADILVMGSAFYTSTSYQETMERLNASFGNR